MPKVSTYGDQRVGSQVIQADQRRAQDFSGVQAIAGALGEVTDQKVKEAQKLSQARVNEAETNLHAEILDIDNGFRSLKGKDAVDGQQKYWQDIDGAIEKHRSTLKNKSQNDLYQAVAQTRKRTAQQIGQAHSREQLEKYNLEQKGAVIVMAKQDSIQSPFNLYNNQKEIDSTIRDMFAGSSEEFIEAKILEHTSQNVSGVLTDLLKQEKVEEAKIRHEDYKKQFGDRQIMTAEAETEFQLALEKMTGKVEVSRAITELYNTYDDDIGAMETELWDRFSDKPEQYQKAMQLLNTRMNTKAKGEKKENDIMLNGLADLIVKGQFSTENFSADQLETLDAQSQQWLEKYEYMLSIEANEEASIDALVDFIALPNEQKRDPNVLGEYLREMNDKQQDNAVAIYRSLTLGSTKTAEVGIQESRSMAVKQMYEKLGIDGKTNAKQAKQSQLTEMYFSALDRYAKENGKEPDRNTAKEIEADIMREFAIYSGYEKRSDDWLTRKVMDTKVPAYRFEIPTDTEGNSLMSESDRQRAIEAIRQTEQASGRFIPLTPAVIWGAHIQLREPANKQRDFGERNLPAMPPVESGETSQGMFDNDPMDAMRDAEGNLFKQVNVNSYEEAVELANSEIPSAESERAREIVAEVDRKFAIDSATLPYDKYELMTEEERPDYLRTLSYDDRFRILKRFRMEQYVEARKNN